MPTETPVPPPEAVVIRLTREAANVTIPQAAKAAGISTARWSQVEAGRETRRGVIRPVRGKARTIAHMAQAVGVTPERLESEGQRPDAAEILREILRTPPPEPAAPDRRLSAVPDQEPFPEGAAEEQVRLWIVRWDGHPRIREMMFNAWEEKSLPRDQREIMVRGLAVIDQSAEQRERRRGAGSLTGC